MSSTPEPQTTNTPVQTETNSQSPAVPQVITADWHLARELVAPLYEGLTLFTGESRLDHADGMVEILRGIRDDEELLASAYLFTVGDCVSDADDWITKTFGTGVLQIVHDMDSLMRLSRRARSDSKESGAANQTEALRRMQASF